MRLDSATAMPLNNAATTSHERLETAARELESQFAHMLIKSMRSASLGNDPLAGNPMYRDMQDQQLAKDLTKGKGLGLAPSIVRQLERSTGPAQIPMTAPAALPLRQPNAPALPMALPTGTALPLNQNSVGGIGASGGLRLAPAASGVSMVATAPLRAPAAPAPMAAPRASASTQASEIVCDPTAPLDCSSPEAFVKSIWPFAQKTAAELGVSAKALVAQAALETGWGKRLVGAGQSVSHNLFGIKAGARWIGEKVSSATHEFVDGVRQNARAEFRAYGSAAESFSDYKRLLSGNRYAAARGTGDDTHRFARALQEAGYATDPSYASKITAIANGTTLNNALASIANAVPTPGN